MPEIQPSDAPAIGGWIVRNAGNGKLALEMKTDVVPKILQGIQTDRLIVALTIGQARRLGKQLFDVADKAEGPVRGGGW